MLQSDNRPFKNSTVGEPLGIKNHLMAARSLGQIPLGTEFYWPQSAQSLAVLFSVTETPTDMSEQDFSNETGFSEILTERLQSEETPNNELEKIKLPLLPKVIENLAHLLPELDPQISIYQKVPSTQKFLAKWAEKLPDIVPELPEFNSSLVPAESAPSFLHHCEDFFDSKLKKSSFSESLKESTGEDVFFTPSGLQRQKQERSKPQPIQQIATAPVTIQAKKTSPTLETHDLDIIAEKVYKLLKYRLQIEAEKSGGHRSGRLR